MNILIFDMDGVLLQPLGYHRALQETVRQAGLAYGYENLHISLAQIARFEALGISCEWHSSALCHAVIAFEMAQGEPFMRDAELDLDPLFTAIAAQPMDTPALQRGLAAIDHLVDHNDGNTQMIREIIRDSETIERSATMSTFQELILGSRTFTDVYGIPAQFREESYLLQHDRRLLSEETAAALRRWSAQPENGAAIMTNRPSRGPDGSIGEPDAEMGVELVGLTGIPLVGFGEIRWMAERNHWNPGTLNKPAPYHALAAILAASGWDLEDSLRFTEAAYTLDTYGDLDRLHGSTITVFEDTPGGLISVEKVAELLGRDGVQVGLRKIGVAEDPSKQAALAEHGAEVYADIERALAGIDDFRAFAGD